ncbi:MAG: hypothetical protein JXQ87_11795 [Bacteroidia bacterium]
MLNAQSKETNVENELDLILATKKQTQEQDIIRLKNQINATTNCGASIKCHVVASMFYSKSGDYDLAKQELVGAQKQISNCTNGKYLQSLVHYADAYNYSILQAQKKVDSLADLGLKVQGKFGGSPSTEVRLYLLKASFGEPISQRLTFAKKALEISQKKGVEHFEQKVLMAIATCYESLEKPQKAKAYFEKALKMVYKRQRSILDLGIIYNNLAYYSTDSAEILAYLDSAAHYSKLGNDLEGMQYAVENKSYYLNDIRAYRRAYNALSLAMELKDSLLNIKKIEAVSNIEEKYNSEKKTNEIQRLKLDSINRAEAERVKLEKQQQEEKVTQRRNRIQYSAVLILVILLATFIATSSKMKIKPRIAEGMIFFFFILLFEFALVVTDPWVDSLTRGQVGYKIAINTVIALILFALHQRFENALKRAILHQDIAKQKE